MKCSIITIHHIHNFGSVFQGYALARFLQLNGYETEIIDYRPDYYNHGKSRLKTAVGRLLNLGAYFGRKKKFEAFISKHDTLSHKIFYSLGELEAYYHGSDNVFIAGGDQLWNDYHPCGKDDAYKLVFTNSTKKLAYGTSMGRDTFDDEALSKLSKLVKDFHKIMLREKCTVPMLQKHTSVPVEHVIDPVGLLDTEEFRKIAVKPKIKEPYAVMYLADSGELLDGAVEILSKKMGLKIVHICGFKKKCYCDYFVKDAGPEEILGYILNADFVLSASFHATMFSLLFNKPFATLLPGEKTNARINDILSFSELGDRILHSSEELANIEKSIDFSNANRIIEEFIFKSKEALLDALKNVEKKQ